MLRDDIFCYAVGECIVKIRFLCYNKLNDKNLAEGIKVIIEFKYSVVQDLMYHILAHMKVDNPSNLYSEAYIDNVKEIKKVDMIVLQM